jgi:hypothetical protein
VKASIETAVFFVLVFVFAIVLGAVFDVRQESRVISQRSDDVRAR